MFRLVPFPRIEGLKDAELGLSQDEAHERQNQFGYNNILDVPQQGWRDVVLDTARDPMIWFLLGTSVLFAWLGDFLEAIVLVAALIPIVGMDAYLHRRTQATVEGLAGRLASHAWVMRDGGRCEISALDLVPGDLAIVVAGTPIPADGIILRGDNVQVDESALSGEAMPVRKAVFDGHLRGGEQIPVDFIHWVTAGTRLLTGEATVRVVYTGAETLYGQIVRSAQASRHERTPLQLAISELVTVLIVVAAVLCIALAGIRYYQGYGVLDAFLSAVTLAVAALPEEFPVVFTFFLGVGVYRLAQRQALVRRAVVVENIGRVTCICTDKTGTLTEGRLRLTHCMPAEGVDEDFLLRIAAMAARPESGDPLDAQLLKSTKPLAGERLVTYPFTEDRRREVAIVREPTDTLRAAAKGAPETLLAMTRLSKSERDAWLAKTGEMAKTGHKVIACASRRLDDWPGGEPDRDYDLIGLLAFEDPLRDGAADAVLRARSAGIKIIMVTGDHPATALSVAHELAIGAENPCVIEGADLAEYLRQHDGARIRNIDVIARAIPAQKLDLVRALQDTGEIVAVTGDGVNDVPALQRADIGIAMGERGTQTAREVASIVLLDDNLRTIVRAIAEGQQLFGNLKLSFAYLLMIHAPLVATAALIPLSGFPLLYLPLHIVWLELIIHPTALLVFQERPSSDELEVVKHGTARRFFEWKEWAVIGLVGALITLLVMFGYDYSLGPDRDVLHARSMAIVALIIGSATVTCALSRLRSRSAIVAVGATVSSAVIIVQLPPLADLLHMSPLHITDWLIAALGGSLAGSCAIFIPLMQRRR